MEKEPPESQEPLNRESDYARREAGASPESPPDWRLTPPSQKRVIKRGREVRLPRTEQRETVKPAPAPRKKEQPRVRYGYRLDITKDMTRHRGEQVRFLKRVGTYLLRLVRPRAREDDSVDRAAWILTAVSGVTFIVMSFLPWFRVTWKLGTGETGGGATTLRFLDLGVIGYTVPVLAAFLAALALVAFAGKLPKLPVDAGVIIGLLSFTALMLLLLVLIGNVGLLQGAGKRSGLGSGFLTNMFMTKKSQVAAYLGVICAIAALTSSLMRLSERKGEGKPVIP